MKFTSSIVLAALFASASSISINQQGPMELFGDKGGPLPTNKVEKPAVMPESPKPEGKKQLTDEEVGAIQKAKKEA